MGRYNLLLDMELLIGGAGSESRAISARVRAALPPSAVMSVPS